MKCLTFDFRLIMGRRKYVLLYFLQRSKLTGNLYHVEILYKPITKLIARSTYNSMTSLSLTKTLEKFADKFSQQSLIQKST